MKTNDLKQRYFDWMCSLVRNKKRTGERSYFRLLSQLDSILFYYELPMDANRESDGLNLRYRFGYEEGIRDNAVAYYIDDRACSVLEMMIALALRCEEDDMGDPGIGNRTSEWFWDMIESLGLSEMYDRHYDSRFVDISVNRFLERTYDRNGRGGLFTVRNCPRDMRDTEIWYQMMYYLNEVIKKQERR